MTIHLDVLHSASSSHRPGRGRKSRSSGKVHGHGMKNVSFSAMNADDRLQSESEVSKNSYGTVAEKQTRIGN